MPLSYVLMKNSEIPIICKNLNHVGPMFFRTKKVNIIFLYAENTYFKYLIIITITRGYSGFSKIVCNGSLHYIIPFLTSIFENLSIIFMP